MTAMTDPTASPTHPGWFARAEAWLDNKGKGAWIAVMVLGFVFFWPVGLAILAYMIWSDRMFSKSCRTRKSWNRSSRTAMSSTGNSAFDAYKSDTLQRLEREQQEFEAFLERLRDAKDKAEFDQFMNERARDAGMSDDDRDDSGRDEDRQPA